MATVYLLSSPSSFKFIPKTHYSTSLLPLKNPSFLSFTRTSTTSNPSKRLILCKSKKNDENIDAPDRLISAICYFYPLFDGIQYGKYVITQFTPLQLIIQPLIPAIKVFKSFPLNGVLVFFTLYFVVVRNQNFSKYVRFNTMQAIVLDILLIFPALLERSFNPKDGIGLDLMMSLDSTVFLFLLVSLIYGSYSCALGQVPRLPIVAEAAERQLLLVRQPFLSAAASCEQKKLMFFFFNVGIFLIFFVLDLEFKLRIYPRSRGAKALV